MKRLSGTGFIPAPHRGFYGWRVVLYATIALALTGPGQTFGVSVFVNPMIDDLGISRTAMTTSYLIGTLVGALALPWIGQAIDRYGVRRVMIIVGALFGAFLIAMSFVSGIVGLTAGFIGIRMMGQGALNLTATTSVALWFSRKRGLAMGIVTAVGAVGMTLVPLLGESLIADYGWRQTWVIEGLVVWALVLPIAIFGIRNRPSDVGQYADGDPAPVDGSDDVWGVKRSEALRTGFFWLVTAAVATISAIITAVVFHQIDLLGSRGLTPTEAAANFIPQTVATLIATLGIGALADRFSPRVVLAPSMVMLAGGLARGTAVTPGFVAISFGMLIGAAGGAMRVVEATELPRYFGTLHIGAIRGVVTSVGIAGAAVGPLAFSLIHDITGNYTTVLVVSIIVPAAVMVATFIVPVPQHSEPDASGESHVVNKA